MIQVSRDPPKCKNCQKVLKWLPWKNGKPQRPVDPKTGESCGCWKTRGKTGGDSFMSGGRLFDKKNKYKPCPYCDGWYHIDDEESTQKDHLEAYHKDRKVHRGELSIGDQCWGDEVLYHSGSGEHWFNGFISVDGKENVREFAKEHGIKVIRDEHLL